MTKVGWLLSLESPCPLTSSNPESHAWLPMSCIQLLIPSLAQSGFSEGQFKKMLAAVKQVDM